MDNIKDGKQITLATGSDDVVAHIPDGEIAQDGANVKIAGTLHLTQAPTSDKTVRLDLDKLIDI